LSLPGSIGIPLEGKRGGGGGGRVGDLMVDEDVIEMVFMALELTH